MEDVIVVLGHRIRTLRVRTELSRERFAAKVGLDRTYYAGIERGERNPSGEPSAKIAAALDVPIAALFSGAADTDEHGECPDIFPEP